MEATVGAFAAELLAMAAAMTRVTADIRRISFIALKLQRLTHSWDSFEVQLRGTLTERRESTLFSVIRMYQIDRLPKEPYCGYFEQFDIRLKVPSISSPFERAVFLSG